MDLRLTCLGQKHELCPECGLNHKLSLPVNIILQVTVYYFPGASFYFPGDVPMGAGLKKYCHL
jgi:hypothetical protein